MQGAGQSPAERRTTASLAQTVCKKLAILSLASAAVSARDTLSARSRNSLTAADTGVVNHGSIFPAPMAHILLPIQNVLERSLAQNW
jgi:hypothetical protein